MMSQLIKAENLIMRPIRNADIDHVFRGLSHPEVIKYYGVSFSSLEETKVQMEWYANIEKDKTGIWWAICDQTDKDFFGAIGFNDIHPEHHRAEIGFWILPAHWGKGIIPEAARVVCDYAFETLGLHRIYAYVESENNNSKKVLSKMGFEYEGTMKEYEIKNGKWIDLEIFGLLHKDQD